MKYLVRLNFGVFLFLAISCSPLSGQKGQKASRPYEQELKAYWYDGQAEITSYTLNQARYGEMREGYAVLIFVTEDFSKDTYTKADTDAKNNVSVLKMNATRNFNTGIYPYSLMTSTFLPFDGAENVLKVSNSCQEWCGHTYLELRNRPKDFQIFNASYFQSESQQDIQLPKALLEDEIWSMIRLNPNELPLGKTKIIPSFMYLRFSHVEMKAYDADLSIQKLDDQWVYSLEFPELERFVKIRFNPNLPFNILGWEETYASGWGENKKTLTSSAKALVSVKSDYWKRNTNMDSVWRQQLMLP
jgi:hypothetical protein